MLRHSLGTSTVPSHIPTTVPKPTSPPRAQCHSTGGHRCPLAAGHHRESRSCARGGMVTELSNLCP